MTQSRQESLSIRETLLNGTIREDLPEITTSAVALKEFSLEALNRAVVGELRAKNAIIAGMIAGMEDGAGIVALTGPPSGGKSDLLGIAPLLITGGESERAHVRGRMDLPEKAILPIGSILTRQFIRDGQVTEEQIASQYRSAITADTRSFAFDEFNNSNPAIQNILLDLMQKGYVDFFDEHGQLRRSALNQMLIAWNNYGEDYTQPIRGAVISRLGMGCVVGLREKGKLSETSRVILHYRPDDKKNVYDPKAKGQIGQIISEDNLRKIVRALDSVKLGEKGSPQGSRTAEFLEKGIVLVADTLSEEGVIMHDVRITKQIVRVARALSLMGGSDYVTENAAIESTYLNLMGKMAALTIRDTVMVEGQRVNGLWHQVIKTQDLIKKTFGLE